MLAALVFAAIAATPAPAALVHHPVSTTNVAAQARFDEGLTLVYSFNRSEARARFEAAGRLDPKLAMAWWGVALAVGPNINESMDASDLTAASDALAKARRLEPGASPEERRLIDALAERYPAKASADTAKPYGAYRDAMKAVAADYPADLDAATLYAESIMDLDDVGFDGGTATAAHDLVASILGGVLKRDPHHLGANHYTIHVWDYAGYADRALPSARYLSDLPYEPADSHLQHMPGHTYLDVGDLADMLRVGRLSTLDDDALAKQSGSDPFSLIYHAHNLEFWLGAAILSGERGEIDQATAEYVRGKRVGAALSYAFANRFLAVDAWPKPASSYALAEWYYARCLSALGQGDTARAAREVAALDVVAQTALNAAPTSIAPGALAHARLAHALGDDDKSLDLLRRYIAHVADLPPEAAQPWFFPAGQWLGDVLLERNDLQGAEAAYRAALVRTPRNPRVLYGLMRVYTLEGKLDDARALAPQIAAQWLGDSTDLHAPAL